MSSIRWAKILTSGSPFEVTSITASSVPDVATQATPVFANPQGHFETTSSIVRRNVAGSDPFGSPSGFIPAFTNLETVLDVNDSGYSINVPDLPVSVSFITNSIKSTPDDFIISSAMLFTDVTGGLQYSSSFFIEPILTYEGSQSATANNQMQIVTDHGDESEGDPVITASLPMNVAGVEGDIGIYSQKSNPIIFATSSAPNYIIWDEKGGRYLRVVRTSPSNLIATASFNIPFTLITSPSFINKSIFITYKYFQTYTDDYENNSGLPLGSPFYSKTLEFSPEDLSGTANSSYVGTFPFSGSFTGSFPLKGSDLVGSQNNKPFPIFIEPGIYTLTITSDASTQLQIGFPTSSGNDGTAGGTGLDPFKFEIEGQSQGVLDANIILGGITSGAFEGEQFGNYSESLSGVTLNSTPSAKGIKPGDAIDFRAGGGSSPSVYRGQLPVTASVALYNQGPLGIGPNKSGLQFEIPGENLPLIDNPIFLTESLPGDGLFYSSVDASFDGGHKIVIGVATDSGLEFADSNSSLKLTSSFANSGLEFTNDKISASLVSGFGLAIVDNKLTLTRSLAGDGLTYINPNNQSQLQVLSNYVVERTKQLRISSSTPNPLLFQKDGSGITTNVSMSYTGSTLAFAYTIGSHDTLNSISGGLLINNNDLSVLTGSGHNIELSTLFTTQPFLEINSGSTNTTPFNRGIGGIIIQTSNNSGSAVVYDEGQQTSAWSEDSNRILNEVGWMFSTSSTVGSTDQFPPYGDGNALSPVDKDYIALAQTVKTNNIENPNEGQSSTNFRGIRASSISISPATLPAAWFDISNLTGNSSTVNSFALAFNSSSVSSQFFTASLSGYTFNIPVGSEIKGILIRTQVSAETSGDTITNFKVLARIGTGTSFTTVTEHGNITDTSFVTLEDGGSNNLLGLSGVTPSNIDDLVVSYTFFLPPEEGAKIRGFYTAAPTPPQPYVPAITIFYNTPDDQNNLFYATSSISNYGAIYVNTGSVSNNDSPVWMYSTD